MLQQTNHGWTHQPLPMPRPAEARSAEPALVLGDVEFIILELLNTSDLYGLELLQAIGHVGAQLGDRFAFRPGQLFPALQRLVACGLLSSASREVADGVRRRHYILTPSGRATLESF